MRIICAGQGVNIYKQSSWYPVSPEVQRDVTSDLTLPRLPPSVTLSNPCHRPCQERPASPVTSLVAPQGRPLIGGWDWVVLFVWLWAVRGEEVVTVTLQGGLSYQTTSHLPSLCPLSRHCTLLHQTILLKYFHTQFIIQKTSGAQLHLSGQPGNLHNILG